LGKKIRLESRLPMTYYYQDEIKTFLVNLFNLYSWLFFSASQAKAFGRHG